MHRELWILLLGSVLIVACASDDDPSKPSKTAVPDAGSKSPATVAAASCKSLVLPKHDKAFAAQFEVSLPLEPGMEREVCALFQLGDEPLALNASEVMMSRGSHHGVIWSTTYETLPDNDLLGDPIELGKVIACEGGANSRFDVSGVIAGSQGGSNLTAPGVLPANTALSLPARAYVVMNFHMLNSTEEPLEPCMKAGLLGMPKEQVEHEAGVLFFYNGFIAVPAGGASSARMACPITQPIMLKSAVSHMHQHGVAYKAKLLDGDPYDPDTKLLETLYETEQWESPKDRVWDDAMPIAAGSFIDYQCDYQNATTQDVAQGLETSDEMCMFSGMYWPADSQLGFCANSKKGRGVGSGGYMIGAGKLSGSAFMTCVLTSKFDEGAADRCGRSECKNYDAVYSFQRCFVDACEEIGKYTRPYLGCVQRNAGNCSDECKGQPITCQLNCLNGDRCKELADSLTNTECK